MIILFLKFVMNNFFAGNLFDLNHLYLKTKVNKIISILNHNLPEVFLFLVTVKNHLF